MNSPLPFARPPHVGIVGATGLVGEMMRELLAERHFPLASLRLFASARSAGKTISWGGEQITVDARKLLEQCRFGFRDIRCLRQVDGQIHFDNRVIGALECFLIDVLFRILRDGVRLCRNRRLRFRLRLG